MSWSSVGGRTLGDTRPPSPNISPTNADATSGSGNGARVLKASECRIGVMFCRSRRRLLYHMPLLLNLLHLYFLDNLHLSLTIIPDVPLVST